MPSTLLAQMKNIGFFIPRGICHGSAIAGIDAMLSKRIEWLDQLMKLCIEAPNLSQDIKDLKKAIQKGNTINETQKKYLNLLAFFDAVCLQHRPNLFENLLSRSLSQMHPDEVAGFTISEALEKKGGLVVVNNAPCICTLDELEAYLKTITTMLDQANLQLAFEISSHHHAVSIGYDVDEHGWSWFENGNIQEKLTAEKIAVEIFDAFLTLVTFDENELALNVKAFSTGDDKLAADNLIEEFKQESAYKNLHEWKNKMTHKSVDDVSLLHIAAQHGHTTLVKLLLENGDDPNKERYDEATPLAFAENVEIVRMLLQKGANIEKSCRYLKTPLHYAIEYGSLDVIKELLAKKANLEKENIDFHTPLFTAVFLKRLDVVKALLRKGADPNPTDFEKSLLHYAIEQKDVEIVKQLLCHNANINKKDHKGLTPLYSAVMTKNVEIIKLLLDKNPDFDIHGNTPMDLLINASNKTKAVFLENCQDYTCLMKILPWANTKTWSKYRNIFHKLITNRDTLLKVMSKLSDDQCLLLLKTIGKNHLNQKAFHKGNFIKLFENRRKHLSRERRLLHDYMNKKKPQVTMGNQLKK